MIIIFSSYDFKKREIFSYDEKKREEVKEFLKKFDLKLEKDIDFSLTFEKKGKIIATGSSSGKVLKDIAVDQNWKNKGLSVKIIDELMKTKLKEGYEKVFVFTRPNISKKIQKMGFKEIVKVEGKISLLEFGPKDINDYLLKLKNAAQSKINRNLSEFYCSAIVMNCNPFTIGHQYLIEKAASSSDLVFILLVTEDKSIFPYEIRRELIEKGTSYLDNVIVLEGGDYIISSATFPTYFTHEKELVELQAMVDVKIFSKYIAPALNIKKRYVGEEPYCPVTKEYNNIMSQQLPKYGLELEVIERFKNKGKAVSASRVRDLLKYDEFDEIKNLVPETTYKFLISERAKYILKKIKESDSRH